MKPPRFEYHAPRAVDEALALLARQGDRAKVLAGGQSLIPLLNFRLAHPEALVDINRIGDLAYVRATADGLAIGALTRQHAVERSDDGAGARAHPRRGVPLHRPPAHPPPRHHRRQPRPRRSRLRAPRRHGRARGAAHPRPRAGAAHRARGRAFFVGPLTTALEPGELLVEVRVPDPPRPHGRRLRGDGAPRRATSPWSAWPRSSRSTRPAAASARASPSAAWAPRRSARAAPRTRCVGGARRARRSTRPRSRAAAATSPPSDVHGSADFPQEARPSLHPRGHRDGGRARDKELSMPTTVPDRPDRQRHPPRAERRAALAARRRDPRDAGPHRHAHRLRARRVRHLHRARRTARRCGPASCSPSARTAPRSSRWRA